MLIEENSSSFTIVIPSVCLVLLILLIISHIGDAMVHPIILTDAKKQQLMQQNQPDPALASSGEAIQGPAPGTQTSLP